MGEGLVGGNALCPLLHPQTFPYPIPDRKKSSYPCPVSLLKRYNSTILFVIENFLCTWQLNFSIGILIAIIPIDKIFKEQFKVIHSSKTTQYMKTTAITHVAANFLNGKQEPWTK